MPTARAPCIVIRYPSLRPRASLTGLVAQEEARAYSTVEAALEWAPGAEPGRHADECLPLRPGSMGSLRLQRQVVAY